MGCCGNSGNTKNVIAPGEVEMCGFRWNEKVILGEGSYGTVLKGYEISNNKTVAVKRMNI